MSGPLPRGDELAADDTFIAHVTRVLGPRPAAPPGAARAPTGTAPAGRTLTCVRLWCSVCGWAVECLKPDAARFGRGGCLACTGALVPQPGAARWAAGPGHRRAYRRRPAGPSWLEVRAAAGGLGPDLAIALADVSDEGLGVRLVEPVRPGEQVLVVVRREDGGVPAFVPAEVRWCAAAEDWTYRAGLRLSRPLAPDELSGLAL